MKDAQLIVILLVVLSVTLFQAGSVKAVSINASFTAVNGTVGLNQNLFFNISADFPQTVTYTIYMNNESTFSGQIPENFPGYRLIFYNVTNTPFGNYQPSIKFSTLSSPIRSSTITTILAMPSFGFIGYSNYTSYIDNSAKLLIGLVDNGNTPMNFTWTLPLVQGIAFSLNYRQAFSLLPSQTFKIPMNLTLSSSFARNLNFSFFGTFRNTTLRKDYTTELFSPVINMSFQNGSLEAGTGNTSIYFTQIRNGNNLPVNTTFQFFLNLNGNELYYNRSAIIYPDTNAVNFTLPRSQLLNVNVYYNSQNGTAVKQQIFSQTTSSGPALSDVLTVAGYIAILAAAVLVLVWLHIRFNKKA